MIVSPPQFLQLSNDWYNNLKCSDHGLNRILKFCIVMENLHSVDCELWVWKSLLWAAFPRFRIEVQESYTNIFFFRTFLEGGGGCYWNIQESGPVEGVLIKKNFKEVRKIFCKYSIFLTDRLLPANQEENINSLEINILPQTAGWLIPLSDFVVQQRS